MQLSTTTKYTLSGLVFGLAFPLVAWTLDIILSGLTLSADIVVQIHQNNPIHYIVDLAPFVLGTIFYFLGTAYQQVLNRNYFSSVLAEERVTDSTTRFKLIVSIALILILLFLVFASRYIQDEMRLKAEEGVGASLDTILITTEQAAYFKLQDEQVHVQIWARTEGIVQKTQTLIVEKDSRQSLIESPSQARLRSWFKPIQNIRGYQGFFIISAEGINLASSSDINTGEISVLTEHPDFLQKIWQGSTALSSPHRSHVALMNPEGELEDGLITMFAGAPIKDAAGEIIAALAFRLDPRFDLSTILKQGRIGKSGDTYAFITEGEIITQSRFSQQIKKLALVYGDTNGVSHLEVRDPGVNLILGEQTDVPRSNQPFTRMAISAIAGQSGRDLDGYRDYRGVPVIGSWMWSDRLGFGMTTEIDMAEAYAVPNFNSKIITISTLILGILILGFVVILTKRYLTERKLVEEELRKNHTLYGQAAKMGKLGHWEWDVVTDQLVACSEQYAKIFGSTVEQEFAPSSQSFDDDIEEYIHEEDRERYKQVTETAYRLKQEWDIEYRIITQTGKESYVRELGEPVLNDHGEVTKTFGTLQDISERKQAGGELRKTQALYSQAEKLGKLGHWEWDKINKKMTTCSEQFAQVYEMTVDDALKFFSNPGNDSNVVHPEDRDRYEQCIRDAEQQKKSVDIEYRIITRTGKVRHIRLRSEFEQDDEDNVVRSFGVEQDITELRQKESALNQAQKMEAVGQLTGGIAHDFNNLLSIISGNLRFLQQDIGEVNTDIQELFEDAMSAVDDGAELTQRLLGFSRSHTLVSETRNVNETIEKFTRFLSRTLGEGVELDIELPGEDLFINIDPSQLENALLNLSINARDAMPEGGKIIISATQYHHGDGDGEYSLVLSEGNYIKISVADKGTGISAEELQHVYEPFFTTKEVGKGSGLGLSMVYGFTQQSNGACYIDSNPGEGTTVSMYFPEVMDNRPIEKSKGDEESSLRGSEVILVVEDEPRVRRATLRDLKKLGYITLEAENAAMAKTIIESGEHIDLLFSDILMPGEMDGHMLCRWTEENYPEIKIVLTSGYSKGKADVSQKTVKPFPIVRKPYFSAKLAKQIRTTLLE